MLSRILMMFVCFVAGCIIAVGCTETDSARTPPKPGDGMDMSKYVDPATGPVQTPDTPPRFEPTVTTLENGEPSHITVQHVLIGFKGSVRGKNITRSKEEAEQLANEILERARTGEDFSSLVEKYTDDSPPGIYRMANHGQQAFDGTPVVEDMVFERGGMVPAFGDVGFPLEVGEIGIAEYHTETSPYGWHVIKRIK